VRAVANPRFGRREHSINAGAVAVSCHANENLNSRTAKGINLDLLSICTTGEPTQEFAADVFRGRENWRDARYLASGMFAVEDLKFPFETVAVFTVVCVFDTAEDCGIGTLRYRFRKLHFSHNETPKQEHLNGTFYTSIAAGAHPGR